MYAGISGFKRVCYCFLCVFQASMNDCKLHFPKALKIAKLADVNIFEHRKPLFKDKILSLDQKVNSSQHQ